MSIQTGKHKDKTPLNLRSIIFRGVLGISTLLMLMLSVPLWIRGGVLFPRVPFVALLPEPAWSRVLLFTLVVIGILGGILYRQLGLIAVVGLGLLVLGDQHRFQPWAYQFGLMALVLAALRPEAGLSCCRVLLVVLYCHSGLSKLDTSFGREIGLTFLTELTAPIGLDPLQWPPLLRTAVVLLMPLGELAIGIGLISQRTRQVAILGAIVMHMTLIAILGPWGLNHSTIVLLWNASLIVEVVVLFAATKSSLSFLQHNDTRPRNLPVLIVVAFVSVMPFSERSGYWDTWPSFALYASHPGRVFVLIHEGDRERLPDSVQPHLQPLALGDPWQQLDLTEWSRSERGTPAYPQARASVGVAEAITQRFETTFPLRLIIWGPADRFTGRRSRLEFTGFRQIRMHADSYKLNAHPALFP